MTCHTLRHVLIWTLAVAFCLALLVPGLPGAADKGKERSPAAKPASKPADKDQLPQLSDNDLKKIDLAVPAKATATPKQPRKLLVFWRCEGFFHGGGIAGGNQAIELTGQKTGAWTTDISRDYEVFDPANLAKYDAVVLNNTTGLKFPDEQKKQALLDFVQHGKGLVGIHAATDNFGNWPEAAKMIGGLFAGHPWGGGGTWAFKLDEPDHVLLRAFAGKGFQLKDEIYMFREPYTRADRRVLLSLDLSDPDTSKVVIEPDTGKNRVDPKSGKPLGRPDNDYAVAWIKAVGQGRVFYCSLGHGPNVFQDPAVDRFYLDGIQYALGDLDLKAE
ncbi:MAG: ThuA domain-containing protein [Planctomycetota bacterium]|nr:ThuA domain-containing protein [Planctomycetota bacterium]